MFSVYNSIVSLWDSLYYGSNRKLPTHASQQLIKIFILASLSYVCVLALYANARCRVSTGWGLYFIYLFLSLFRSTKWTPLFFPCLLIISHTMLCKQEGGGVLDAYFIGASYFIGFFATYRKGIQTSMIYQHGFIVWPLTTMSVILVLLYEPTPVVILAVNVLQCMGCMISSHENSHRLARLCVYSEKDHLSAMLRMIVWMVSLRSPGLTMSLYLAIVDFILSDEEEEEEEEQLHES